MFLKTGIAVALGALLATIVPCALLADVADLVRPRVEGMRELGAAFKNVKDELKSSTPQIYIIQLSARQIRSAAKQQHSWFQPGSEPRPGVKTKAKPDIWARSAEFTTAQDRFATEASAFVQAAGSGDIASIRTQALQLGRSCHGCHMSFRVEDEE